MKKIILLSALAMILFLEGSAASVFGQESELPGDQTENSSANLHEELELTLKKVKTHYERVQDSLVKSGVDRDPTLDAAITELEKDRNSTMERLEGLAQVLLESGEDGTRESEDPPDIDYEALEKKFREVLEEMQVYIDAREKHWDGVDIDSEEKLKAELERLIQEQEFLSDMVSDLAAEFDEVWEEVKSGWADKLKEWEDLIEDIFSDLW
jgi:hypothetical protein